MKHDPINIAIDASVSLGERNVIQRLEILFKHRESISEKEFYEWVIKRFPNYEPLIDTDSEG